MFGATLSPIIMEVENGGLEDVWFVSKWAIFHFHNYGRKGKSLQLLSHKSDLDSQMGS